MINIVWQTHKLILPESTVFLQNSTEQTQKFTRITSRRADFIHPQRKIKEILHPEKHAFSIKSEHKGT